MTDSHERSDLLRGIVESIDQNQSNADWGREFGQAVFESGDEELIVYVLSDAGEKYRSSQLTKLRKRASDAAYKLVSSTNGERAEALAEQMEMPIVVPGFPPLSLGTSNHYFLRDACAAAEKHLKGFSRNLRFWQRYRDKSEPWPDESIRTLLDDGRITPVSLQKEDGSEEGVQ